MDLFLFIANRIKEDKCSDRVMQYFYTKGTQQNSVEGLQKLVMVINLSGAY